MLDGLCRLSILFWHAHITAYVTTHGFDRIFFQKADISKKVIRHNISLLHSVYAAVVKFLITDSDDEESDDEDICCFSLFCCSKQLSFYLGSQSIVQM